MSRWVTIPCLAALAACSQRAAPVDAPSCSWGSSRLVGRTWRASMALTAAGPAFALYEWPEQSLFLAPGQPAVSLEGSWVLAQLYATPDLELLGTWRTPPPPQNGGSPSPSVLGVYSWMLKEGAWERKLVSSGEHDPLSSASTPAGLVLAACVPNPATSSVYRDLVVARRNQGTWQFQSGAARCYFGPWADPLREHKVSPELEVAWTAGQGPELALADYDAEWALRWLWPQGEAWREQIIARWSPGSCERFDQWWSVAALGAASAGEKTLMAFRMLTAGGDTLQLARRDGNKIRLEQVGPAIPFSHREDCRLGNAPGYAQPALARAPDGSLRLAVMRKRSPSHDWELVVLARQGSGWTEWARPVPGVPRELQLEVDGSGDAHLLLTVEGYRHIPGKRYYFVHHHMLACDQAG